MPMNRLDYPRSWDLIAHKVKSEANWTCEQCGKPCRRPGVRWDQFTEWLLGHPNWDIWHPQTSTSAFDSLKGEWCEVPHPQRFTLTVSHADHVPRNCDRSNLRALCAPCHCRYDLRQMGTKQRMKRERQGQMTIENL